ncbi:hypothetical protein McpSp1_17410 [Methanocorpusculaceae archaeon Sp1]|nr:hypothetical protein [Methanocorpusculaceae archaeon Sp1]
MSELIDKIHGVLSQSDHKEMLFFVSTKSSKEEDKNNFVVKNARINTDIGTELKNNAMSQLSSLKNKDTTIQEYGTLLSSDQTLLETISYTKVPNLLKLISDMVVVDNNEYTQRELLANMFGYIVRVEVGTKNVYLFKKYSRDKALAKNIFQMIFSNDGYQKLDPDVIALSPSYDAMLLIESVNGELSGEVLVISRSYFESFFRYEEIYLKNIENNSEKLSTLNVLNNLDKFVTICKGNRNALRKLSRIIVSDEFDALTKEKLLKTISQYNVQVSFDALSENIVVTDDNYWIILRLLDDDYVKSDQTGFKYESHSKQRR